MGKRSLLIMLSLLFFIGCSKAEEESAALDYRWFDRDIYFAISDVSVPGNELRNNFAHQQIVKDALIELGSNTQLGASYFRFKEVDENQLSIITEDSSGATDFKSFVMILPGPVFQSFVFQNIGSGAADPNAFLVVNAANKRQFYMVFNADCFQGSSACGGISLNGMKALVLRQMGFFLAFGGADCSTKPNNIMCVDPSDAQWMYRASFFRDMDNMLENIVNTPNFFPVPSK